MDSEFLAAPFFIRSKISCVTDFINPHPICDVRRAAKDEADWSKKLTVIWSSMLSHVLRSDFICVKRFCCTTFPTALDASIELGTAM